MGPILVFGHRNPDNDSICSAVAYAHLKNLTDPDEVYVPARLGPVPAETAWVFSRFGMDLPEAIEHVHTRVQDAMTAEVVTVRAEDNLLRAGSIMREHVVRALPVVDADGTVRGLLDHAILAELYLGQIEMQGFETMPVTAGQLAEVLDGRILTGDPATRLSGHVLIGAMEPETMLRYIAPGDTLIVGDRLRTQPLALEAGAACLIVTGGAAPEQGVIDSAAGRRAVVISSPNDTYATARLVGLGHAVGGIMDSTPLLVSPDALLAEIAEDLMDSPRREAVVVDEGNHLLGIITRTNLARGSKRRVILLDHNELSQSAPGVEGAAVIEIVDHHRIGDVETAGPILFLNMPVGATATIVAERYRELDVTPTEGVAGILLAAVLSDTVLLKSPTTTPVDQAVAARLGAQLGVDPIEFGLEMFRARSERTEFSARDAVATDLKEYRVGDLAIGVAQVEVVDLDRYLDNAALLAEALEAERERRGWGLAMLLVTDVVNEGSQVFAAGKRRVAERALGIDLAGGSAWMPGVLSRKKQVASRLLEAAGG